MLFNSFQFALLLAATLLGLRTVPARARGGVLLGASLLFYLSWIPQYLFLLLGVIGVNWLALRAIYARRRHRFALGGSITVTLGLLASFKYAGFFGLDVDPWRTFLPLGISFYSFQIVGLAIDAYRKPEGEAPGLARYALFVCFFPQLIAGPILRGRELLPQLAAGGEQTPDRTRRGLWLLVAGLTKKVVLADFLLSGLVDQVFATPGTAPAAFHWIALYSFAFQIYFDFSGYTDMARGAALLMGYELPENFREPYLALNPNEFWRGWHITLTSWFRDYVYVPLGLSDLGRHHLYLVMLFTWGLVGLWHGAAWTFVFWGLYHGLLLSAHRAARPLLVRVKPRGAAARRAWVFIRWLATFNLVAIGLMLFRCPTTEDLAAYARGLFEGPALSGIPLLSVGIVLLCLALHAAERWARARAPAWRDALAARPWAAPLEGLAIGALVGLAIAAAGTGQAFIYFQF